LVDLFFKERFEYPTFAWQEAVINAVALVGFFKFIELEDYLSEKLGTKVDLVTEDALKPFIKPYVMETIAYV
jgi:predicted nucleotidyltransferase